MKQYRYALFRPHFYKSITAVHIDKSRLLHIDKNFVHERWEQYFKIELYPFTKKIFLENVCPVCGNLVNVNIRVFNLIANVNKQLIAYFGQTQLIAIL